MDKHKFGKQGSTPKRIGNLSGKTYVITGTASGTGFEAIRILFSKKAKMTMLNRNPKKSKATIKTLKQKLGSNIDVLNLHMDLAKLEFVRTAASMVLESVSRIDALIYNAAIGQVPVQ